MNPRIRMLCIVSCAVYALILVTVTGLSAAVAADQNRPLHVLFDEHFEWQKRESPSFAMSKGDYRYAERLDDASLAAIERRFEDSKRFLQRLHAIPRDKLNEEDRLNYDLFEWILTRSIRGHAFRTHLAPIGGRFGPQQRIPQLHERVRFAHYEDYVNYLKRLEQVPKLCDDTIEKLARGIEQRRTPPQITLRGVPEQFGKIIDGDALAALAEPFEKWPGHVDETQRREIRSRFESTTIPAVRAAVARLGAFVEDEYIPKCRTSIAALDWPDGERYYAHQLRYMTTTDLTARQIHELGLSEVKRIRAEMMEVIRRSDFMDRPAAQGELRDEELFRRFIDYLRSDPRFYYEKPEALLAGYRDICKQIDAHMPRLFKTLPRLPYGVRAIPAFMAPSQTTAYYSNGSLENGQPGYFYANTYQLGQRPKYEMRSLAAHEAVPGHHHQISIAQELENVPEFRKNMWVTAFGEGWALYAERLGIEMGLYEDPYDDFGRLLYEIWRACRLVVDPGMHALGWSRDQAIEFMLENSALSEINIKTEVDRYIAWPGQATAYKIGELRIRALRAKAEEKLGDQFDLREFHDVILTAGPLPLHVLEARVVAWIESYKRAE